MKQIIKIIKVICTEGFLVEKNKFVSFFSKYIIDLIALKLKWNYKKNLKQKKRETSTENDIHGIIILKNNHKKIYKNYWKNITLNIQLNHVVGTKIT